MSLPVSSVSLRSVVCLIDRFPALTDVNLEVSEGEVVLLSGGNGAGKTTLLRLIAGLVPAFSGEVIVLGKNLRINCRAHRDEVALVAHETGCYDELTVRENLYFFTRSRSQPTSVADDALDQLGLGRLADTLHGKLSAGQRRRLSIAKALAISPRLLLLDEPHAGLDADGREILDEVLRDAAAKGRTVILASHEIDRSRALADREIELQSGKTLPVPAGETEPVKPVEA